MKKVFKNLRLYSLFLCGSILFMISCNNPEEGCLDIRATNFGFDADRSCDGCCTYPKLFLSISHSWESERPFRRDSVYNTSSDTFRVKDVRYFISGLVLEDENNEFSGVEEIESIPCGSDTNKEVVDDFKIINLGASNYSIGSFRKDNLIQKGTISIGLDEELQCVESSEVVSGILSQGSILFDSTKLELSTLRWIIQKDTSVQMFDTIRIELQSIPIAFDVNQTFKTGQNDTLIFTMNYEQWLLNVDMKNQTNEEIAEALKINLPNSFEFGR